jgi:threonine/homoserine/homoserine lactone efflux protein
LPESDGRQPGFLHGAALQWLNPKAWIASFSGISAFEATPDNGLYPFAALYLVICFLSVAVWAFAGERVSELVGDPVVMNWLNRLLGALLVAVAAYLFYLQFANH